MLITRNYTYCDQQILSFLNKLIKPPYKFSKNFRIDINPIKLSQLLFPGLNASERLIAFFLFLKYIQTGLYAKPFLIC